MTATAPGLSPVPRHADLVVVGARISGALTAYALAPYARSVLVLERGGPSAYWPQQVSWDRPDNLIWDDLGLTGTVLACGAPRLRGHTRRTMDVVVDCDYPADDEHSHRMSVPREVLDPALAARAESLPNVTLLHRAKVTGVLSGGGRVTGVRFGHGGAEHEVSAGLVVFADGRTSRNAERVGATPYHLIPSPWTGLLSYYRDLPLPEDRVYYSRQPGSMLIVTPCGPSLWCVATGLHRALIAEHDEHPARTYLRTAAADPVIGPALAAGEPTTSIGGAGRLRMHRRPMAGPGWCLVGDSGYHLDPMSAMGARAVLTTVRLLRDRIADLGRVSGVPADYLGLTERRDALLADEWDFTERILHTYAPTAAGVERARLLAADPGLMQADLRARMGLAPAGAAAGLPAGAAR